MAFTCDSRLVLGAEDHNAVRVWEARTGKLLNIALTGHRGKVSGVAASPTDPKMAVSCSSDRSIKVWKLDRGVCERSLHFTSTARRVTTMADNGNVVLSGHFDGRLRFWDLRAKHSEPVHEVELHTGKEIYSTTASAGGGLVVTVGRDNAVSVVDTRTFSLRSRLSAPTFEAEAWATPAINPSATHVAAGSKDGTLFLWEIASSKPSPGGAPTGAPSSGAPAIVRLRQPKSTSREQQGAAVVACAWSPAGLPLVTGDRLGGVTFWGESGS